MTAPARREVVRVTQESGLGERHAPRMVGMSASALRYRPCPDGNVALRERIVAMAQRHRRYRAPMIYLKLRRAMRWRTCTSVAVEARRSRWPTGCR